MLIYQSSSRKGIQTKFLLGLAAILIFFSTLASLTIYIYQKEALVEDAYQRAKLLMTAMDASRGYVRAVLRPKMYDILDEDDFILEAMSSSYISRAIMELVTDEIDDITYRRVSINARNPKYEAVGIEKEMIEYFSNHPMEEEWRGIVPYDTDDRVFMRFQPVTFTESCMHCHGSPEQAPQKVISAYGKNRGFNRQVGEVAGVISVALPIDISLLKIKELAFVVFSAVIPSILVLYVVISLFFNKLVAQNLRGLLTAFKTNLRDEKGLALLEQSQTYDEIEELTGAAETIAEHMEKNKITLEKYASEILHSKELLQSVFNGITDPVVLLDKDDKTIKTVNKAFLVRYNREFDEVIGQTITSHFFLDSCPIATCESIIDTVEDQPLEKEISLSNGNIFQIYFYPVLDKNQSVNDIVCYVKEITKQRKYEQQIQHTEKLVAIGQLAAGIAHEINNPLGVILCHLDLIKDETSLSTQAIDDLRVIEKHVGSCKQIISDLLRFARQSRPSLSKAAINTLVEDVVTMSTNQLEMQNIKVVTQLFDKLPLVSVDVDKIRQVLLNLILNAAQAIETNGTITISSAYLQEEALINIQIEDDGCGIPVDLYDKIFDPFFTTKAPGKGTGLGLSVSYSIIQEHGGTISIDSNIDEKFTRFTISLPVEKHDE